MSKLNSTVSKSVAKTHIEGKQNTGDTLHQRDGKAKARHDGRKARFENSPVKDADRKHKHHKPGSMNMKKAGR